jgi:hypothetical protein
MVIDGGVWGDAGRSRAGCPGDFWGTCGSLNSPKFSNLQILITAIPSHHEGKHVAHIEVSLGIMDVLAVKDSNSLIHTLS